MLYLKKSVGILDPTYLPTKEYVDIVATRYII